MNKKLLLVVLVEVIIVIVWYYYVYVIYDFFKICKRENYIKRKDKFEMFKKFMFLLGNALRIFRPCRGKSYHLLFINDASIFLMIRAIMSANSILSADAPLTIIDAWISRTRLLFFFFLHHFAFCYWWT